MSSSVHLCLCLVRGSIYWCHFLYGHARWGSLCWEPAPVRLNKFSMMDTRVRLPVFPLFRRLLNEPFEKCSFERVLGATVSTVCVQPGFSHKLFRSSNQQTPLRRFFFFFLVFILNQTARAAARIRLANGHSHTSHPAALMWDRALSSLFVLPLPSCSFVGGGDWWERGNIVRIREEEESQRPRGEEGAAASLRPSNIQRVAIKHMHKDTRHTRALFSRPQGEKTIKGNSRRKIKHLQVLQVVCHHWPFQCVAFQNAAGHETSVQFSIWTPGLDLKCQQQRENLLFFFFSLSVLFVLMALSEMRILPGGHRSQKKGRLSRFFD